PGVGRFVAGRPRRGGSPWAHFVRTHALAASDFGAALRLVPVARGEQQGQARLAVGALVSPGQHRPLGSTRPGSAEQLAERSGLDAGVAPGPGQRRVGAVGAAGCRISFRTAPARRELAEFFAHAVAWSDLAELRHVPERSLEA